MFEEQIVHTPQQNKAKQYSPISSPHNETSTQRKIKKTVLQSAKLEQMLLELINKMEEWQEQLKEIHTVNCSTKSKKDEEKTWELRQNLKQWIDEFSEPIETQQFEERESGMSSENVSEIFQQKKYNTLTDKVKFIEDMLNKNEQNLSLQHTPQKAKIEHQIKIELHELQSDVSEMEQTSKKQKEERKAFIERFRNDQEMSQSSSVIGIPDNSDQIPIIDYYDHIKRNTQEQCRQQYIKELNAYKRKVQQISRIHIELTNFKQDYLTLKQEIVETFNELKDQQDKLITNSFEQQEMKLNQVIAKNNSNRQQIQNYIQELKKEQLKLREEFLKFKLTDKQIEEQINNSIKQLQNLQGLTQTQQFEQTQQVSILSDLDQPSIQEQSQDEMQIILIQDANQLQIDVKEQSNKAIYKLIIASYCQKIQKIENQIQAIKDKNRQKLKNIINSVKEIKNEQQTLKQLNSQDLTRLITNSEVKKLIELPELKLKQDTSILYTQKAKKTLTQNQQDEDETQVRMESQEILEVSEQEQFTMNDDDHRDEIEEQTNQTQKNINQLLKEQKQLKLDYDLIQRQIKSDADKLKIDQQNGDILKIYKIIIQKLYDLIKQNEQQLMQIELKETMVLEAKKMYSKIQQNYEKVKNELNKQQTAKISSKQKKEIGELIQEDAEEFGIETDKKNIIQLYMEIKSANKQSLKIEKSIQIQQNLSYEQLNQKYLDLYKKEQNLKDEIKQLEEQNNLVVIACNNLQQKVEDQQQQIDELQQIIDQKQNQIKQLQEDFQQNKSSQQQEIINLTQIKNHILAERSHYEQLYNDRNKKYNEADEQLFQYQQGSRTFTFATNSAISSLVKQIQNYLKLLWYKDQNKQLEILLQSIQQIQGEIRRSQIYQNYEDLIKSLNNIKNISELIEKDVIKYVKRKREFGVCELE